MFDPETVIGPELDILVAIIEQRNFVIRRGIPMFESEFEPEGPADEYSLKEQKMWLAYCPSTRPADGQPLMEKYKIASYPNYYRDGTENLPVGKEWIAAVKNHVGEGPTQLIAAMRCLVILGETKAMERFTRYQGAQA